MALRKNWVKRFGDGVLSLLGRQPGEREESAGPTTRHQALGKSPAAKSTGKLRPIDKQQGPLSQARLRQRISKVFGASHPVQERSGLCGRDAKLAELLDGVRYRHNHAVICGPRGSGKTSLARVFGDYADEDGAVVLYMAGSDEASFDALMKPYLKQIPDACCAPGSKQQIAEAADRSKLTAASVVDLLTAIRYSQVVFIFDEFDRITSAETKVELTTLMKLTSDACLKVSYVVVGIAENLHELITAHASLRRHLTIVTVEPLADEAIGRILSDCFDKIGLACDAKAKAMLTAAACGSPYHARLFGMHAAFQAAPAPTRRIGPSHVRAGLRAAYNEWRAGNPQDAAIFERIAALDSVDSSPVVRLASQAAYRHAGGSDIDHSDPLAAVTPPDPPDLLRPSLEARDDALVFRDSLAPQFLLIALRMGGVTPAKHAMEAAE